MKQPSSRPVGATPSSTSSRPKGWHEPAAELSPVDKVVLRRQLYLSVHYIKSEIAPPVIAPAELSI